MCCERAASFSCIGDGQRAAGLIANHESFIIGCNHVAIPIETDILVIDFVESGTRAGRVTTTPRWGVLPLPDERTEGGHVTNTIGAATLVCAGVGRFGGLGKRLLNLLYKCAGKTTDAAGRSPYSPDADERRAGT